MDNNYQSGNGFQLHTSTPKLREAVLSVSGQDFANAVNNDLCVMRKVEKDGNSVNGTCSQLRISTLPKGIDFERFDNLSHVDMQIVEYKLGRAKRNRTPHDNDGPIFKCSPYHILGGILRDGDGVPLEIIVNGFNRHGLAICRAFTIDGYRVLDVREGDPIETYFRSAASVRRFVRNLPVRI